MRNFTRGRERDQERCADYGESQEAGAKGARDHVGRIDGRAHRAVTADIEGHGAMENGKVEQVR